MTVNHRTVAEVARLDDPIGVLSVYVDASPDRVARETRSFGRHVRDELHAVAERVRAEGDRERLAALEGALRRIDPELDAVLDLRGAGRGHALFATLGGDAVRRLDLPVPLPDLVALEPRAVVAPLVIAATATAPAGLVAVDRGRVLAVEWTGEAETVLDERHGVRVDEMGNQGGARGTRSIPQSEEYERQRDAELARQLERSASRVADLARRRGWQELVLAGDPRVRAHLRSGAPDGCAVVESDLVLGGEDHHGVARALAPLVVEARERLEAELVQGVLDAALSGGRGALGREAVATALEEGRVAELLVAPDGATTERLLHAALDTSATVRALQGGPAERLSRHGGVAAILRW